MIFLKFLISQETVNYLIERSKGDRINLKNELIKIENFSNNKAKYQQKNY